MKKPNLHSLFIVLVLIAFVHPTIAQLPVISSFSLNGVLVCTNLAPGSVASVEWAASLSGPWSTNWAGLDAVTADSNGTIQVGVPMFYRIREVTNTPPSPPGAPVIMTVGVNYGLAILTWSTSAGATSYNVKRSPSDGGPYFVIGNTSRTNYTDNALLNGRTYYYVVSATGVGGEGTNSAQVSATLPLPPVPDPQIGYVDFPATAIPPYTSVFHPVVSFVTSNYLPIVIVGAPGSQTFYTYGATGSSIPDPTSASACAPNGYVDGLTPSEVAYYTIDAVMPDLIIKAIGEKDDGSPSSAMVQARFQFVGAPANGSANGSDRRLGH